VSHAKSHKVWFVTMFSFIIVIITWRDAQRVGGKC